MSESKPKTRWWAWFILAMLGVMVLRQAMQKPRKGLSPEIMNTLRTEEETKALQPEWDRQRKAFEESMKRQEEHRQYLESLPPEKAE